MSQRARWTIIATACLLLLMCLLLVGVTLRMAPLIDDMGKSIQIYIIFTHTFRHLQSFENTSLPLLLFDGKYLAGKWRETVEISTINIFTIFGSFHREMNLLYKYSLLHQYRNR